MYVYKIKWPDQELYIAYHLNNYCSHILLNVYRKYLNELIIKLCLSGQETLVTDF